MALDVMYKVANFNFNYGETSSVINEHPVKNLGVLIMAPFRMILG